MTKGIQKGAVDIRSIDIGALSGYYPEINSFSDHSLICDIIEHAAIYRDRKVLYYAELVGQAYFSFEKYENVKSFRKKSNSVGLDFLRIAFGDEEKARDVFKDRWSKRHSAYDPFYVSEREGISVEEAEQFIQKYKADKATSKAGFVRRWGEDKGIEMFEAFQITSASCTFENWIRSNAGGTREDYTLWRKQFSPWCSEYWIHRFNMNYEEARQSVLEFQRDNAGVRPGYYRKKGVSEEQIKAILKEINSRKDGSSLSGIRQKHPDLSDDDICLRYEEICASKSNPITEETKEKIRASLEAAGIWVPRAELSEYQRYKREVWDVTRKQRISEMENFDRRGPAGQEGAYHLDHVFSMRQGYLQGIPPDIIGSSVNLKFIPFEENVRKQCGCSISREELMRNFKEENED